MECTGLWSAWARRAAARCVLGGLLAGTLVLLAGVRPTAHSTWAATHGTNPAIFQLLTLSIATGQAVVEGTAFFVASDGTALTNSHVVYFVHSDPAHYRLIALHGREFYGVTIVCTSTLAVHPKLEEVAYRPEIGRDVAEIKVGPWRVPGAATVFRFTGGPEFLAHLGRLPNFPALQLGIDPAPGTPVHVIGYGLIQERVKITPWEQWTTEGVVKLVGPAKDGTPVFTISSLNAPRLGNSGSPVLGDGDLVVGILTWLSETDFSLSGGIASSALKEPCAP